MPLSPNGGHRTFVYTGMAYALLGGATSRMTQYQHVKEIPPEDIIAEFENGNSYLQAMAKFVKKLLLDGYELSHVGVLFLVRRDPNMEGYTQAFTRGLEAAATLSFWTVWHGEYSIDHNRHYLRSVCTWDVNNLPYGGLCSHNPLTKGLSGYGLSAEALAIKKERRAQQVTEAARRQYVKINMLEQLVANGELKPDHPDAIYARERREKRKEYIKNHEGQIYAYQQRRRRQVQSLYNDDKAR
ncbi:hypothetical protein EDD37DRAFT_254141 [Exophiala viscosa]|uniref:Uncharacterized protein n=1 Tax=Exophiala viscosa TaxID=2486360 RepID=A0AAN6II75_9EURO|nr:hypothetical protein EDD36DRAFT_20632 [Exophiala viscosa]KAI1627185.1 hypothetical protein EDD37DRAFT_254141 [Exophiala viscosa]